MNEPRRPDEDPHGDLGSMDPARQAPFPGTEPTVMPENQPDEARPADAAKEERRGPLWDEPARLSDDERRGPLWGSPGDERTAESALAEGELTASPVESVPAEAPAEAAVSPGQDTGSADLPTRTDTDLVQPVGEVTSPVSAAPTDSASTPDAGGAASELPAPRDVGGLADHADQPELEQGHTEAPSASASDETGVATPPGDTIPEPLPRFEAPLQSPAGAAPPGSGESPQAPGAPVDQPAVAPAPEASIPRYTPEIVGERKDPSTAFLLELIPGLFGFLGIGYLYAGRTNDGVIRLAAFLIYNLLAWTAIVVLSIVVVGLCLIPVQLAIQIGVPIWSALQLRKEMETTG
ncbi:MAG: hypothetical protein KatS3mg060_3490 [Dehalococcoidia bacterium]|nr:MAG: hypothetical protein KatS3mg060_3490 [Dehalococcoidia bacterium]